MTEPRTADLVLEGGGVLGIGHVGALSVLDREGYDFARVAGSSVGALVGSLVAAGMSVPRLTEIMLELDFARFKDKSLLDRVPLAGPATSLLLENGVYEGQYARDLVADELAALGVTTFGDLRVDDPNTSLPPDKQYSLVVTATDITLGRLVYLPWDYREVYGLDPDEQSVADAVRASISVPYFFEPATITAADGRVSTLVDGGVLANYPIEVFDRTDGQPPRWPTFGVKILPRLPEGADSLLPGLGLINHGPVRFGAELAIALLVGRDQARLDLPWVAARTMLVDTSGVGPLDFGLSDAERDMLFGRGVEAAEEFLAGWDWADYLRRYRS